jgi:ubiquitin C-terminal hydrolase
MKYKFECGACKGKWEEEKRFWDLSLPIPRSSVGCNLHDCVGAFARREILEHELILECPTCKQKRETTKQFQVVEFPSVMILQLNRFDNDRKKISTQVDIPIKNLDPQTFHFGCGAQPITTESYDLFAACCHSGEYDSGHYTAIRLQASSDTWTDFDGTRISGIQRDEVTVLFYSRSCKYFHF